MKSPKYVYLFEEEQRVLTRNSLEGKGQGWQR